MSKESVTDIRKKAESILKKKKGTYKNTSTGEDASITRMSCKKLTSGKAAGKSVGNGFTVNQHFEAVSRINVLYSKSSFISSAPDKKGSPDIVCVKRYGANFKFKNGDEAFAYITVKEYKNEGDKIYSLELKKI